MDSGFVILKDGEIVGKEQDFGNACELQMILDERHPDSKIQVKEFVGCIIEG